MLKDSTKLKCPNCEKKILRGLSRWSMNYPIICSRCNSIVLIKGEPGGYALEFLALFSILCLLTLLLWGRSEEVVSLNWYQIFFTSLGLFAIFEYYQIKRNKNAIESISVIDKKLALSYFDAAVTRARKTQLLNISLYTMTLIYLIIIIATFQPDEIRKIINARFYNMMVITFVLTYILSILIIPRSFLKAVKEQRLKLEQIVLMIIMITFSNSSYSSGEDQSLRLGISSNLTYS